MLRYLKSNSMLCYPYSPQTLMLPVKFNRYSNLSPALFLSLTLALGLTAPVLAQNYRTTIIEEGEQTSPEEVLPGTLPVGDSPSDLPIPDSVPIPNFNAPNNLPSSQSDNLLSLQGGQRLMEESNSAVGSQNYPLAIQKLQEARQVYNQLSNFYSQLADSFSGIDNRISEAQRDNALKAAEMRDRATYQLALVHRAQTQPELSVPLLVQIVRSQNPTTELGKKSYQQLFELGFVDSPYPRPRDNQAIPSTSKSDILLSLQGGQRLVEEANSAVGSQNYPLAIQKFEEARQVYNQLSNLYSQLADVFSGIDNRIYETHRAKTLNAAELRDRATYQLALVHRAQNRPELAVPLLTQIVKSQNPTTELGKKAFQQLFELGFVDSPYPSSSTSESSPATSAVSNQ